MYVFEKFYSHAYPAVNIYISNGLTRIHIHFLPFSPLKLRNKGKPAVKQRRFVG